VKEQNMNAWLNWNLGLDQDGITREVVDRDDLEDGVPQIVCSDCTPEDAELIVNGAVALNRTRLASEVLDRVIDHVQTLLCDAGDLGGQLAYLLGALCNTAVEHPGIELDEGDDVLDVFRTVFPADHKVWQFIDVIREDSEEQPNP
jgi:hypothetical protein